MVWKQCLESPQPNVVLATGHHPEMEYKRRYENNVYKEDSQILSWPQDTILKKNTREDMKTKSRK